MKITVELTREEIDLLIKVDSDLRHSASMEAFYLRNKITNAISEALHETLAVPRKA